MEQVYLVFCNSKLPLSPVIRAVTWGRWSHVALLVDAATVIEATGADGVHATPLSKLMERSTEFCIVEVDVPRGTSDPIKAAIRSQLGKDYDWWGIAGLSIRRDWQDPANWWCSELVAWAFQQGGAPLFRADALHRITPHDLWKLPFKVVYSSS